MADIDLAPRHLRGSRPGSRLVGSPDVVMLVFLTVAFVVLAAPFMLMPLMPNRANLQRRELAPAPSLVVDGKPNPAFLSDLGAYIEDHFALKGALVEFGATFTEHVLQASTVDNVVVGKDGWLYYTGELSDFQRSQPMSDAALDNAAGNIALMQEYIRSLGKDFCLVIAPNKSTVAGTHMPYYEIAGEGVSNLERLEERLLARGVAFIHAGGYLDGRSYFVRDTHWTDAAALRISCALFDALSMAYPNFYACDIAVRRHVGDLESMLHPVHPENEVQVCHTGTTSFTYANEATSVEDPYIVTNSALEGTSGAALVYRDSFGNNLLPPFATTFGQAVFTKLVPYDMSPSQVMFATDVVVERAERHLDLFATDPPTMPAPMRMVVVAPEPGPGSASVSVRQTESFLVVEGELDEAARTLGPRVFCELTRADGTVAHHECFRMSGRRSHVQDFEGDAQSGAGLEVVGDGGYRCSIPITEAPEVKHVRVLVGNTDLSYCVSTIDL